jgi:hypothetical protein
MLNISHSIGKNTFLGINLRMIVKSKLRILSPLILVTLLSCGSNPPPPPPPVNSIDLSGPSDPYIKLNGAATISANPKDSSGNVIGEKKVTWASSDPTIATIDPSGVITPKRLGAVKFTASVDNVQRESPEFIIYGVQIFGGTYNNQNYYPRPQTSCSPGISGPGTMFFFNMLAKNGTNTAFNVSIQGPLGWNDDKNLTDALLPQGFLTITRYFVRKCTPALTGEYNATINFGADTFTFKFNIDSNLVLPFPGNVKINALKTQVLSQWDNVQGANSYTTKLYDVKLDTYIKNASYVNLPSVNFTGLNLAVGQYDLILDSFNINSDFKAPFPSQINNSYYYSPFDIK